MTEQGTNLTKPYTAYANLTAYNESSRFGPPLSPIIPPMQNISLPKDYANYGYNSLSHDFDGNGYYTIDKGYGSRCTDFYAARCPQNVPLPAPAPPLSTPPPVREDFFFDKQKELKNTIRNLKLEIYVDDKCGNCRNMKKLMSPYEKSIVYKDINIDKFYKELIKHGATGLPYTYSLTLNTAVRGTPPSVEILINKLAENKKKILPQHLFKKLKELDLVVYTMESCTYCQLYKKFMEQHGINEKLITIIPIEDKEKVRTDPYLTTNQLPGFPFTMSRTYKTSFPGVPRSIEELINLLTQQST